MITSGVPINSEDALNSEIIEEVFEDALIENAINFIKSKLSLDSHPIVSKLTEKVSNIKNEVFENFSNKIEKNIEEESRLCACN